MGVDKKQKTPFERLLETGLTYWVRSKCKSIGSLKIIIKGLSLGFPNNQVSDINLIAKEVNFKDIHFEQLNINAELIKFKLNLMNRSKGVLSIKDDFKIEGRLSMSSKDINQVLSSLTWFSLKEWIISSFFSQQTNVNSQIKNNLLILQAFDSTNNKKNLEEKIFLLQSKSGNLLFRDINSCYEKDFPIEDSIFIKDTYFSGDTVNFLIESTVKA